MKPEQEPQTGADPHPGSDREKRRAVALQGYALLEDGRTTSVSLVNLSYNGCKVETAEVLATGSKLKLSVIGLGGLDAEVCWCADGAAGLRFAPDDVPKKDQTPRAEQRLELSAEIALRRPGRQHYQARIFDLSRTGCRIEFVERPRVGELVWAKFDGLDALEAEVRWMDGFFGGIEFKRAIYPAVFELLLARLG